MGALKDGHRWLEDAWPALLLPPLCLVLIIKRLHYGIDFTDESFYVALAYRFAMGDQPFVDEYNLAQVSGVLLSPFVSAFLVFNDGQPDGMVLFVRYLHLAFSALVASTVFLVLRRHVEWQIAILAALLPVVFTPLGLHSISYITLGSGCFVMGCFLGLWYVTQPHGGWVALLSGVAHGLAVISYPTLIVPSTVSFLITSWWCGEGRRLRHALFFVFGSILVGLLPMVLLLRAGYHNVEIAMAYVLSVGVQGGGLQKLVDGSRMVWNNIPHKSAVCAGLVGIWVFRQYKAPWSQLSLTLSVVCLLFAFVTPMNLWTPTALPVESLYLVINVGLLGPIFIGMLRQYEAMRRLFTLIWIPSFLAGLVVSWSSGNGARMGAIGMLPAAIVSLAMVATILARKVGTPLGEPHSGRVVGSLAIALVLCVFLANQYLALYREEPVNHLTVGVQAGPYKGIYTTQRRDLFVRELVSDLRATAKQGDRVLFFDGFPAGYLMSTLRPASPTVWLNSSSAYPNVDRTINEKYYARSGIQPDLVVRLKRIPRPDDPGLRYPDDDPIVRYVRARYRKCLERPDYEIYVKQKTLEQLAG